MRIEDDEEAPPLVQSLCSPVSFSKKGLEASERNMILAATRNRHQLDLVEQAMKIQIPDDGMRNHDDRTGKYHDHISGGAVDEDDDLLLGDDEGPGVSEEDLDALATAQEAEAEALTLLVHSEHDTEGCS